MTSFNKNATIKNLITKYHRYGYPNARIGI